MRVEGCGWLKLVPGERLEEDISWEEIGDGASRGGIVLGSNLCPFLCSAGRGGAPVSSAAFCNTRTTPEVGWDEIGPIMNWARR